MTPGQQFACPGPGVLSGEIFVLFESGDLVNDRKGLEVSSGVRAQSNHLLND